MRRTGGRGCMITRLSADRTVWRHSHVVTCAADRDATFHPGTHTARRVVSVSLRWGTDIRVLALWSLPGDLVDGLVQPPMHRPQLGNGPGCRRVRCGDLPALVEKRGDAMIQPERVRSGDRGTEQGRVDGGSQGLRAAGGIGEGPPPGGGGRSPTDDGQHAADVRRVQHMGEGKCDTFEGRGVEDDRASGCTPTRTVLMSQVNQKIGRGPIEKVVTRFDGQWEWCVEL